MVLGQNILFKKFIYHVSMQN